MGHSYTIFIGTVGNGLQYSRDGGESWDSATTGEAPPNSTVAGLEGNVRALGVYPMTRIASSPVQTGPASTAPTTTASLGIISSPRWRGWRSGP